MEQTRESLTETESDAPFEGDFRAAVVSIRSDLGFDPDSSPWSETQPAARAPIVPMLAELLATAKTPGLPAESNGVAMAHRNSGSREPDPPPRA